MDLKTFWLLTLVLIGLIGTALTYVKRRDSNLESSGNGIILCTVIGLGFWIFVGAVKFFSNN